MQNFTEFRYCLGALQACVRIFVRLSIFFSDTCFRSLSRSASRYKLDFFTQSLTRLEVSMLQKSRLYVFLVACYSRPDKESVGNRSITLYVTPARFKIWPILKPAADFKTGQPN